MAGIAHFGIGFASKRFLPSLPLWLILLATEFLDIIWLLFYIAGFEKTGNAVWSHSLLMAVVWSVLGGAVCALIYRKIKNGIAFGLLIASHWILDLITHPMGVISGNPAQPPDLPLTFDSSLKLGFGLYNHSFVPVIISEVGITALGLILFLTMKKNQPGGIRESALLPQKTDSERGRTHG